MMFENGNKSKGYFLFVGHKMNIAKNDGTHQITENSVSKYIENTKMLLGHGIKVRYREREMEEDSLLTLIDYTS
jgi:hypothetical protein